MSEKLSDEDLKAFLKNKNTITFRGAYFDYWAHFFAEELLAARERVAELELLKSKLENNERAIGLVDQWYQEQLAAKDAPLKVATEFIQMVLDNSYPGTAFNTEAAEALQKIRGEE